MARQTGMENKKTGKGRMENNLRPKMKIVPNNRTEVILKALKEKPKSIKELMKETGYGQTSVRNRLNKLIHRNYVKKAGTKKLENKYGPNTVEVWDLTYRGMEEAKD